MKLCFFLKDSNNIIYSGKGDKRVTRNVRVRKQRDDKEEFLKWNLNKKNVNR